MPVARRTHWRIEKDPADVPNGAVASENGLATDVGVSILRRGGNAVDAAVATAFALAVVEPAACGLGGGGVLLVDGPGQSAPVAIDFAMTAPRAAAGAYELLDGIGSSRFGWRKVRDDANVHGPSAAATPGFVAGLDVALRTFGTMSLAVVLAPAIRLAEHGIDVTWPNTLRIAACLRTMAQYPETLAIFAPGGTPLNPAGAFSRADRLVQRDLGRTLRLLARGGIAAFHEGDVAETIERWARTSGCLLSGADLATYRPVIHDAAQATTIGAWEVHGIPGPSGCFTAQQTLNVVDRLWDERGSNDPVRRLDLFARASRSSFADRRHWSTRPSGGDIPYAQLLGAEHAAQQADEVEQERGRAQPASRRNPGHGPGPAWKADSTTHLIAVDRDRTVVTLTATLADNFGSAVVVPGTGILLNNAMQWFNPEPGTAISIGPGRRSLHNMTPLVVRRDGRAVLAVGAAGGVRIIDALAQIVLNATLRGMPLGEALAEPRIDASGDALLVDARLPRRVKRALASLGHDVRAVEDSVGGHQFSRPVAVAIDHSRGRLVATVDPLRPGVGAGY